MFSGNKDVDREILLRIKSDDILLKACSVNKYALSLCDDMFFYNRVKREYPIAFQIKENKEENWKQYFLSIIKYKYEIKRLFGFMLKDGDFKKYFDVLSFMEERKMYVSEKVNYSIQNKINEYAKYLLENRFTGLVIAKVFIYTAIRYNNLEMLKYLFDKYKDILTIEDSKEQFLLEAIIGFGLINKEDKDAIKEQYEILSLVENKLKEIYGNEINYAKVEIYAAAEIGDSDLLIYITQKFKDVNVLALLLGGAAGGFPNIVLLALERMRMKKNLTEDMKKDGLNKAMLTLIEGRYDNVPSLHADKRDYFKVADILVENGADNIVEAFEYAANITQDETMYNYLLKFL